MRTTPFRRTVVLCAVLVATAGTTFTRAQQRQAASARALTTDDYARAERFMPYNTTPLVSNGAVRPTWLPGDRFWYRNQIAAGSEFVVVDPATGSRAPAFNHAGLAASLSSATGKSYDAARLPFMQFTMNDEGTTITVTVEGRQWTCDVQGKQCNAADRRSTRSRNEALSPDGKQAAFIRDYNLWVRDIVTGAEKQLTTDGVKEFGYATDNAGWTRSDRAILVWSPDSKKIATFQQDERGVGEMYLVSTTDSHPVLQAWKYPLPGDEVITTIQRVIIDVESTTVVRLQMPPDQHRSSLCDDVWCGGEWQDVQWHPDGSQLAFVSTSRDHKHEWLRVADARTGAVREIMDESAETFFESGNGRVNWRYLPNSNEVIWFSERDNWGHLYLYDLAAGQLKHKITTGEGNVTQLLRVDEQNRMLYFVAVGLEARRDPYFRHFYRIGMDGKGLTLLTSEDADHTISLAPSGRFFVDAYSKPDVAPISRAAGPRWKAGLDVGEGGHRPAARDRVEAADADHGERPRRRQRPVWIDVSPDEFRCDEEVSDHQPHLPRSADRQRRRPQLFRVPRRQPIPRRARLRRRRDRRNGYTLAIEEVSLGVLRRHGR